MKTALRVAVVILAIGLAGCASMDEKRMQLQSESTAARPESVKPSIGIEETLRCIRKTGKLRKVIFAIGPWVDSTGKSNASAIGATGAFLPQAGTATFVTDTIRRAGGKALVKCFGAAPRSIRAEYIINGIFNSLDFGEDARADIQVMGLGPRSRIGWAQLTLSVQLDAASTRLNRQMSVVMRTVRYSNLGVSVGRVWGRTLVTGGRNAEPSGTASVRSHQRPDCACCNRRLAQGISGRRSLSEISGIACFRKLRLCRVRFIRQNKLQEKLEC